MIKKSLLLVASLALLSSCYNYKTYTASPIDLDVSAGENKLLIGCILHHLEPKHVSTQLYYGALPAIDRPKLEGRNTSFGQFGLKANYHFSPFKIPIKLANIGLDYSFTRIDDIFIGPTFSAYPPTNINQHRLMLDLNLATFIRPRMMGYVNGEAGILTESIFEFDKYNRTEQALNLRIGYRADFYLKKNLFLSGELGYGAGSYMKLGINYWLF